MLEPQKPYHSPQYRFDSGVSGSSGNGGVSRNGLLVPLVNLPPYGNHANHANHAKRGTLWEATL
jgi:hypothetical protein